MSPAEYIQAGIGLLSMCGVWLTIRLAQQKNDDSKIGDEVRDHDQILENQRNIERLQVSLEGMGKSVNQHLIDCATQHTAHVVKLESISTDQKRLQRTLENVQSQLRFAAIEGGTGFFKKEL